MSMNTRKPRRNQLTGIAEQLSARDRAILALLVDYRYTTTGQLARLFAAQHTTPSSAVRQSARSLRRLDSHHLVRALPRRIGGIRAGSSGHVWTPTSLGARLHARVIGTPLAARWRNTDPAIGFIAHSLTVTDVRVRLAELAATGQITVERLEPEPVCWRNYPGGPHQIATWLKPDLAAMTTTPDGYEDSWFFEIDQDTQTPARVVSKCVTYQEYRRTGREQASHGVFPAVVWITTSTRRVATLLARIEAEPALDTRLFTVITPDEFETLITAGAEDFRAANSRGQPP